jgi:DNA-binding transcriptional regulator YiaG
LQPGAAKIIAHQQEMQAAEAIERNKAKLAAEQQGKDAAAVVYSPEQIAAAFRDNEVGAEQRFAAPFNVSSHVIDLETGLFSGSHMMLSMESKCSVHSLKRLLSNWP